MKILFLDIDGVVNCSKTKQRHRCFMGIDPVMAFRVGKIVLETDCKIVLSSSWKHFKDGVAEVEKQVHKIYDTTIDLPDKERGYEIKEWLDRNDVERYAILDDDSDMLPEQKDNFFKTDWDIGITDEIMNKVIKHLNTNT